MSSIVIELRAVIRVMTMALLLGPGLLRAAPPEQLIVRSQTRDSSGQIHVAEETLDPRRVGIVVVDPWNYHWCKTATMRVDALIPRINQALATGRSLGMTVMLCPSDVVENYAGWPQREWVLAMPNLPVPEFKPLECPPPPDGGGCACGTERCVTHYGWDGMHPDLQIGADDLMPDTLAEVWTICQNRQLDCLIYVGVHTQVCLLGKPMGLRNLRSVGMKCLLARDLTDAHPGYDPTRNFTPDQHTADVVAHFEQHLAPTIELSADLKRAGLWETQEPLDPVRITPWGTAARPHLFPDKVTITLSAPFQPESELRYTVDGSEPTPSSERYTGPFTITATTHLRAGAFVKGQCVTRPSAGEFFKLAPLPPEPEVHLSDLQPRRAIGPGHTYGDQVRFAAHSNPPQMDKSNEGNPLELRQRPYQKGIGVHAVNQLVYELKPEYRRFVALAGVDEHILKISNASNVGRHPSVVFKVFIDGREMAASPVMRIAFEPWRFDIEIPPGSKTISLATMDAGNGNQEDRANWVNCGFILDSQP